jgi:PiT family inorganic phosphate transporter
MFTLLLIVIGIALLFDLVNGFHDAANSIATVVSTKVLTPFQAVVWAAAFNVLAFWVFDMSVGNTVAKTVDNSVIDLWVILAGLLAATAWNLFTWWLGIPSSSSHTLIGGFAGAAVAHVAFQSGSILEGFSAITGGEIIKVVLFIFLAPIIGGVIAFAIALVTMSRRFGLKFILIIAATVVIYLLLDYMVEFMDMKKEMMYIVMGMMVIFILAYIYYMLVHGKSQTALKESNMYKRLQLLSSAAFSLGHGGADSQKVMGIICAALMVYGNLQREQHTEDKIDPNFRISEVMQIEHENEEGKKDKFKPEFGELNGVAFYAAGDDIIDMKTQEVIFHEEKLNSSYSQSAQFSSFSKADDSLEKLHIYTKGNAIYDSETKELIFTKKELNPTYSKAGMFISAVKGAELKEGYKIKTKVNAETMPFWISFGCYLMIGIGTLFGGWKIVKTMGTKITKVTPLEGVCAETAGALTLFTVSQMGIPVSTTHTITGSIIGVGATKRLSAVRWGVTINLLWAWILTIPVSGLLAALFYFLILMFK